MGSYGTGKTHLASAIANRLLSLGIPVIAGTLSTLLDKIKRSWQDVKLNEYEIMKAFFDCDLLIIDDLGKEKVTDWYLERLYSIINHRYER